MPPRKKSGAKRGRNVPLTANSPDHSPELVRLSRIRGQIDGIEKMITEGRYCPDIMNQVKSATAALRSVEKQLLQRHLKHCVTVALKSKNPTESEQKIKELIALFGR